MLCMFFFLKKQLIKFASFFFFGKENLKYIMGGFNEFVKHWVKKFKLGYIIRRLASAIYICGQLSVIITHAIFQILRYEFGNQGIKLLTFFLEREIDRLPLVLTYFYLLKNRFKVIFFLLLKVLLISRCFRNVNFIIWRW